jgi:hypothetical protein
MSGREPIFLSYCNDDAGILRPVVGEGTINSASRTYDGEKFPGIPSIYKPHDPTANQYDGVKDHARTGQGTIECWMKFNGWSMANTDVSDEQQHYLWNIGGVSLASKHAYFVFFPGAGIYCDFSDGVNFPNVTIADTTWADATWYHVAYTWDYTLGSNEIKVYRDGVKIGEGGTFDDHTATFDIAWGQRLDGQNGLKGWIAGFKVFPYAKTDFSDRENPRGGMQDQRFVG